MKLVEGFLFVKILFNKISDLQRMKLIIYIKEQNSRHLDLDIGVVD